MQKQSVALVVLLISGLTASSAPITLNIWPGQPPDELGKIGPERTRMSPTLTLKEVEVTNSTRLITAVTNPTITVYPAPADRNTGAAMLICPGGGYWNLYWELEGEEVATWLNTIGVTGIILKYRVPRRSDDREGEPARRPLQDAQRALRVIRHHATEWRIDPERVGIGGFSAGGHLAMAAATSFGRETYRPIDELDRTSCRPAFAVPVYSGYLKVKDRDEVSPDLRVPTNAPPVFLVHGSEDIVSPPEHSVLMYLALKRAGVSAELHVYADTAHDFGVRRLGRPADAWTESCVRWLAHQGFLRARK